MQAANAPAFSEHSNVAPAGAEVNANVADVLVVVAAGVDVSAVSGGGGLMVHANAAGVASVPASLTARTVNVWLPSASVGYVCGVVHAV